MNITFIIKTFKRPACVKRLVDSIKKYYPNNEILICNDDETKLEIAGTTVFNTDYDIGLSAGRNMLVDKVKTKYLVLLDDDFFFTEETKIELLKKHLEDNDLDMVGGAIRQPDGSMLHYEGAYMYEDKYLRMVEGNGKYDFILNFFIAKTDVLKKYRWDDELKLAEHTAFFFKHRGKIKIGLEEKVIVEHKQVQSKDYMKYRKRANKYIYIFMKKYNIDKIRNINNVTYLIEDYYA